MKISTNSYALPAFDGKILLRLTLDKPTERGTRVFDYLHDYSCKIEAFARHGLFSRLAEIYKASYNDNKRNPAFVYSFRIISTYENAELSSYLLVSRLYQGHIHLFSNADSLITYSDSFVPPKLICKRHVPNSVLTLDSEGHPSWAKVNENQIVYTKAEKCRLLL